MRSIKRVAVTGSSGLIGSALIAKLKSDGYQVQKIVRRPTRSSEEVKWDPIKGEIDLNALDGVDAIFHLSLIHI